MRELALDKNFLVGARNSALFGNFIPYVGGKSTLWFDRSAARYRKGSFVNQISMQKLALDKNFLVGARNSALFGNFIPYVGGKSTLWFDRSAARYRKGSFV